MTASGTAASIVPGEHAILFGTRARLAGIVTTPPRGVPANDTAVVLLNAGVVHRVGPNRLYVTLARRLSRSGFTVLRFDHSGIGDSLPREDSLSFDDSSVLEAEDAMNWLEVERRCTRFVLVGLCSGTLTAFRVAQTDARVSALVLLTALLQDPSTVPPETVADAAGRRIARSYVTEKAINRSSWLKALTGKANYGHAVRTVGRLLVRSRRRPPADSGTAAVIEQLQRVLERGVRVFFIYAEPTTVLEYFRMTLEPRLPALRRRGQLDVAVLKRADHTFTELRHQQRVLDLIAGWLGRHVPD